jgi:drug/metabolite transporter (DMT)-like permease
MLNSTRAPSLPINPTAVGVLAIAMWAALALLSVLTNMLPPFLLLALCFFISGLLVLLKRAWYREPLFTLPNLTYSQWFVGVGGLFGFHFFYFLAIRNAPALQVSLVCYLWPLLLALYVSSPGNRWLTLLGASIGFIGAGVVITDGALLDIAASFASNDAIGYGYALIAALIWSSYSWYMGKSNNHVEDIGWMSLVVAVLALICHLLIEANTLSVFSKIDGINILAIVLLGLGPVGGAFYLWDIGMKFGHQSWLASLSFATPVLSTMLLALFGIGYLSINVLLALALIMVGAGICNIKRG